MGLEDDPATEGLDAWGLKRLFSHGFRRWKSGAERPKDILQKISIFSPIEIPN